MKDKEKEKRLKVKSRKMSKDAEKEVKKLLKDVVGKSMDYLFDGRDRVLVMGSILNSI